MGTRVPGWGLALRKGLLPFVPLVRVLVQRRPDIDGLTQLRIFFVALVWGLVLILLVLFAIPEKQAPETPLRWLIAIMFGSMAGSLGGVIWALRRPLLYSSPEALAAAYRTLFFLRAAFAQAPALIGFAAVLIVGSRWPYFVGLGIAAVGLALTAPTRRDVQRRQEELAASGSALSLKSALMPPPPRGEEARRVAAEMREHWRRHRRPRG